VNVDVVLSVVAIHMLILVCQQFSKNAFTSTLLHLVLAHLIRMHLFCEIFETDKIAKIKCTRKFPVLQYVLQVLLVSAY
jgi:hypothetical protein